MLGSRCCRLLRRPTRWSRPRPATARRRPAARARVLRAAGIELDPVRRVATRDGRHLDLSVKEFALLEALLSATPAFLSAEDLLEQVWDEYADPLTNTVTVTITVHDMTRQIAWLCLVTAAVPAGKANSLAPFLQLGGLGHSRRLPQPGVPRQTQPIIENASLKSTVAVPPQRIWACATSVALRSVECVHTTVYCSLVCRQCSTTTRSPEHHPGPRGLLQYASAALY